MSQIPGFPIPPMMFPAAVVQEENKPLSSELSDDEYYMEQLRKENLLRTVKEMKEKQIFLFEVFIDSIDIKKENELLISAGEAGPLPPLRVRVKFANIPCLDIFEEEMLMPAFNQQDPLSGRVISLSPDVPSIPQRSQHGQWRSSYGKSCLFFMMPMELIHCIQTSPITVNVYRTVADNYEHPASSVGHTRLRLQEDFVDCVLCTGDEKSELPITAYQNQPCVIHNLAAEETGRIDMFVRLSCFGNMISTQFQSLRDGKEYVFKHSPGKSQVEGTYGVQLPEDYQPPKLMGKTDLTTLQPLFACQEQLVGVCIDVEKDLEEDFISKTVLWKERDPRVASKICKHPDVCKCTCLLDKRTAVNISCCEACTCNKSEISIITTPQLYKGSSHLNFSLSNDTVKESDIPDEICRENLCHDCICNQPEGGALRESAKYEKISTKVASYLEAKTDKLNERSPGSVNRNSKKESVSSFKKLQLQGAGDSDSKVQVLNRESVEKTQIEDKREIVAVIATEETKPFKEIRSATTKKVSTVELKKQTKKKEQINEGPNRTSVKKAHAQFDYRSREYPGLNIGHTFCVDKECVVPENMGWLWNIEDKHLGIKLRKGWRPGVISKSVNNRICTTKKPRTSVIHGNVMQPASAGTYKTQSQLYGPNKTDRKESFSDLIDQPPTFRLQHTAGQYYLSMMPIKEEDEEQKPVEMRVLPDDLDSTESERTSNTSIEVFFTCPGALRRKVEKPVYADVDTQYEEGDLKAAEVKRPASEKSKKKKGKKDVLIEPKTVESKAKDNMWEEQQTQMSLQKKKNK